MFVAVLIRRTLFFSLSLILCCSPTSPTKDADLDAGDLEDVGGEADSRDDADPVDSDYEWDGVCDSQRIDLTKVPTRLMVLLDQSQSMNDAIPWLPGSGATHWDEATEGLTHLVDNPLNQGLTLGFDAFPDGTLEYLESCNMPCCLAMTCPLDCMNGAMRCDRSCAVDLPPVVPIGPIDVSGPAIVEYLTHDFLPPTFANTPLVAQMQYFLQDRAEEMPELYSGDGGSYLLIISDGQDTCNSDEDLYLDISALEEVTAALVTNFSIRSLAVGFGDTSGSMAQELNAIAENGGTPFETFFPINEPGALQEAFDLISTTIASCIYEIDEPDVTADPNLVNFYFDGEVVGNDPTCTDGWRRIEEPEDDALKVEFCGLSCDRLRGGEVSEVMARFGCSTVVW